MYGIRSIICFLTDENGNILNPYKTNAISYTCIIPRSNNVRKQNQTNHGEKLDRVKLVVMVKGYISLFMDGKRISEPISLRHIKVCLHIQRKLNYCSECMTLNVSLTTFTL